MSETVLDALVKLFALIGDIHDETIVTVREKGIVRAFLMRHLNQEQVVLYMSIYDKYLSIFNSESITKGSVRDMKRISLNSMRILSVCEQMNQELHQKQKIYILVQLIDYLSLAAEITEDSLDFLDTVASAIFISDQEYKSIKSFIMEAEGSIADTTRILIIDANEKPSGCKSKYITDHNLKGRIRLLSIPSTNSFIFRYTGNEDIYLNGQVIFSGQTYIFDNGSSIRGPGMATVYYSEVTAIFSETSHGQKIFLDASRVNFRFKNSSNGIHNLNLHEESGKLIGIIGGSGAGKSTTLSVLNGTLRPQGGEVMVNGYSLYNKNDREHLHGVIGYVPQDDLLIEELTVFQNIWFNARLCLSNLSDEKLLEVVDTILSDFELNEIRELKVGNPLKKIISGGQRKRVNIALELLRQPTILFVDEPTSGLSSVDSLAVMNLLKDQAYKGKLVIVNIHQPGSEIYKMFDKIIVIDKGGYQVFYGNPTEAIIYFKTASNYANKEGDQCLSCGNIDTDQLLQIIESKVVDEHGKATRIRKVSPEEWAERFNRSRLGRNEKYEIKKSSLPAYIYNIPGLLKQSRIYFIRDLLSKIADMQYILISILGPPVLALMLSYFTRTGKGLEYSFRDNVNIAPYLFMCVITSLFFGLMVSSEEIVKDRKILRRESFLNLSWFSYLNSKVMIMFMLSAIQSLLFVLIGNMILEIKGMTFAYWLVLFTTSCFANIVGLNISSAFNSVITIYILIPFIIIPQLLFSGVLVNYDKLNLAGSASHEYVPLIGDLMEARWSFEALAVEQFKNNRYEKPLFRYNMDLSQKSYYRDFFIEKLQKDLMFCERYLDSSDYKNLVDSKLARMGPYVDMLSGLAGTKPGSWISSLNREGLSAETKKAATTYLDSLEKSFIKLAKKADQRKNEANDSLEKAIGKAGVMKLRDQYWNEKLVSLVLNLENQYKTYDDGEKIIQKFNPAYMKATSKLGRSHFYAPVKLIGNLEIGTFRFNISVIWIISILLYVALYFNLLHKLISFFGTIRFASPEK